MTVVRYEGERMYGETRVYVVHDDGRRGRLEHRIFCHSAGGFDWGYGGSGPSELALNLLAHALGDESTCPRCKGTRRYRASRCFECAGVGVADPVWRAHQDFKWAFIAGLPENRWSLERSDVLEWWSRISHVKAFA